MSKVWVCRNKTAEIPFSIKGQDIRLYSMEELCYYLYQNAEVLEEHFFDEALLKWLERELGMLKLCEELRQGLEKGKDDFWCMEHLIWESGYYSREELNSLRRTHEQTAQAEPGERRKLRADRMLLEGKYKSAVREYYRILVQESMDSLLESRIWHNMGTAYAGQFLYQSAAECYEKAYTMGRREESRQQYLLALSCANGEHMQENGVSAESKSLQQLKEDKGIVYYEAEIYKKMEQLAKEYMRNE